MTNQGNGTTRDKPGGSTTRRQSTRQSIFAVDRTLTLSKIDSHVLNKITKGPTEAHDILLLIEQWRRRALEELIPSTIEKLAEALRVGAGELVEAQPQKDHLGTLAENMDEVRVVTWARTGAEFSYKYTCTFHAADKDVAVLLELSSSGNDKSSTQLMRVARAHGQYGGLDDAAFVLWYTGDAETPPQEVALDADQAPVADLGTVLGDNMLNARQIWSVFGKSLFEHDFFHSAQLSEQL
jgi:hypothetical protein